MKRTLSTAIAITVLSATFAGCASTSDLDAVKADVAKAQQTANEAKASADAANAKIDRAFKKASQK